MSRPEFRTPHKCQNGHFRFLYWIPHSIGGSDNLITWGEKDPECKCPTFSFGEGFAPCGPDEQYSGKKDVDGNKLYAGDILEGAGVVHYNEDLATWFAGDVLLALSCDHRKLIGNIHQSE